MKRKSTRDQSIQDAARLLHDDAESKAREANPAEHVAKALKTQNGQRMAMTSNERAAAMAGLPIVDPTQIPSTFDPSEYEKTPTFNLVLGKRNTGKTTLLTNLMLYRRSWYPYIFVITGSRHKGHWQNYMPEKMVMAKLTPEFFQKLLRLQSTRTRLFGVNARVAVIIDDMAFDTKSVRYMQEIRETIFLGRHYDLDVYYLTQQLTAASTSMRTNADKIFVFTTQQKTTLQMLYEEFATDFADLASWQAFCSKYTQDNQCLVIDGLHTDIRGIERYQIFKGQKVEDLPKFTLCCKAAWGGDPGPLVEIQRKKWKMVKKYSESYMKKLRNTTKITQQMMSGRTAQHKENQDVDPFAFTGVKVEVGDVGGRPGTHTGPELKEGEEAEIDYNDMSVHPALYLRNMKYFDKTEHYDEEDLRALEPYVNPISFADDSKKTMTDILETTALREDNVIRRLKRKQFEQ